MAWSLEKQLDRAPNGACPCGAREKLGVLGSGVLVIHPL